MLKIFLLLIFGRGLTIENFQQCTHITGSGSCSETIYGTTGEYGIENNIGGFYYSNSFLLNSNSEILNCFGRKGTDFGATDTIWKYSIEKKQWKFIKGRKEVNQNSVFSTINSFNSSIEIGSRYSTKGWINGDIITFFGGQGIINNTIQKINEMWRYNSSSNSYSIIQCNNCDDVTTSNSLYTQFSKIKDFDLSTLPGARYDHEIVPINGKEIFLIGGRGYSKIHENCDLGDWYIFSTELMQWMYLGGDLEGQTELDAIYGETNIYHPNNRIGSIMHLSGLLINEEEILIFDHDHSSMNYSSVVFKYNITSNYWKFISGELGPNGKGYFRNYNSVNYPGGRQLQKQWRINENEIILFGGYGYGSISAGFLNDHWTFDIDLNQWKFSGKEITKFENREPSFDSIQGYSDDTLMGGIAAFIGEYIAEKKELIICGGYGKSIEGKDELLDDCWSFYYGNICNLLKQNEENVCSGNGVCSNNGICVCNDGYFGINCEITKCNGILSNETNTVCSGKGICIDSKCLCNEQTIYTFPDCSINNSMMLFVNTLWVSIPLFIIILFLILFIITLILFYLYLLSKKKQRRTKVHSVGGGKAFNLALEERKVSKIQRKQETKEENMNWKEKFEENAKKMEELIEENQKLKQNYLKREENFQKELTMLKQEIQELKNSSQPKSNKLRQ